MRTVFVPAYMETAMKKSGDLTLAGVVCPFSMSDVIQSHMKTMAGSFLPPYNKISKNEM